MKSLKLSFILLDFALAIAMAFVMGNDQDKVDQIDDYNECYEQSVESNSTIS